VAGERSPAGPVWAKRGESASREVQAPPQLRWQRSWLRLGNTSHPSRLNVLLRVANYSHQIRVVKQQRYKFIQEITKLSFISYLELT
jgi:hypothetical protein